MGERHYGIAAMAGLAILGAMSGAPLPRKDTTCRYREPAGPPHPTTRQQKRHLMRKAADALARLSSNALEVRK